jgi:hypothetical protein
MYIELLLLQGDDNTKKGTHEELMGLGGKVC